MVDRIIFEYDSQSIEVGNDLDFESNARDSQGNVVDFGRANLLQIRVWAKGIVATDTLTVQLYDSARRRTPEDRIYRANGSSDETDAWQYIQTDRNIEFTDRDWVMTPEEAKIYGRLTNALGNSAAAEVHVEILAQKVT
jgi:hypothetical protein